DGGRARPVHRTAPLSQAPPHAGRGRTLRRVQRQSLDQPNLPAAPERHFRKRVSVSRLVACDRWTRRASFTVFLRCRKCSRLWCPPAKKSLEKALLKISSPAPSGSTK